MRSNLREMTAFRPHCRAMAFGGAMVLIGTALTLGAPVGSANTLSSVTMSETESTSNLAPLNSRRIRFTFNRIGIEDYVPYIVYDVHIPQKSDGRKVVRPSPSVSSDMIVGSISAGSWSLQ
jgi:hypothetical protein